MQKCVNMRHAPLPRQAGARLLFDWHDRASLVCASGRKKQWGNASEMLC